MQSVALIIMIERTFKNIPDGKIDDADDQSFLLGLGWSQGSTWDDLLQSKRVLIVSEAGAGKTHECRQQAERLWAAGEPAFFVELTALAAEKLADLLNSKEKGRWKSWLASKSRLATFFLDSIDELQLTQKSFRQTLRKFEQSLEGQLHRARIVITTRPIPYDEQSIRHILPVPPAPSAESSETRFLNTVMRGRQEQNDEKNNTSPPEWRLVALMPLSDEQIVQFSRSQGVSDPEQLLKDLEHRNAQEFARRPQDLIELCVDWREEKRIRKHREQVEANIKVKLSPGNDRAEQAELSYNKAIAGARKLALGVQMMRRQAIRYIAKADSVVANKAALDASRALPDLQPDEQKTLLERPLFSFSSYGQVRFHHRSVTEYLAAEQLKHLRQKGMALQELKRILFVKIQGRKITRPSKRAIAGWLALQEDRIFELLRDNDPAVLLNEGDPESLTPRQRIQVLRAYANRYRSSGWRGFEIPEIQIRRFACEELADEINQIWDKGVKNPDVRKAFINLIGAGRIKACADIVFDLTQNSQGCDFERVIALDALVALNDKRLYQIAASITNADALRSNRVVSGAVQSLFPKYISAEQLCQILQWFEHDNYNVGNLVYQLPGLIAELTLALPALEQLRDGLLAPVFQGVKWQEDHRTQISSNFSYLREILATVCGRGLDISLDEKWLHASALAIRLVRQGYGNDKPTRALIKRLANLDEGNNSRLFWVEDALLQSIHETLDPSDRLSKITTYDHFKRLRADRDLAWVSKALGDRGRPKDERAMLLEAAINLSPTPLNFKKHLKNLKPLIADQSSFTKRIDDLLASSKYEKTSHRQENEKNKRDAEEKRLEDKNNTRWIRLYRNISNRPDDAFSNEQQDDTARELWRAMKADSVDNPSSGWSRDFIEKKFNRKTADRLRLYMMEAWRSKTPPAFPGEKTGSELNALLSYWQFYLAGIYAEAEQQDWATKLTDAQARLATKYALLEFNGLPQWTESLLRAHPDAVEQTIGNELSWELNQPPNTTTHSGLLQRVACSSEEIAKVFLPRIESWLNTEKSILAEHENSAEITERVQPATKIILKYGSPVAIEKLQKIALQRLGQQTRFENRLAWLSILMQSNPKLGVKKLAEQIESIKPDKQSETSAWFANLFMGRPALVDLSDKLFTPKVLLCLAHLAFTHIRKQDDIHREGLYSPNIRDDAQRARHNILTALLNTEGEAGLAAKNKMAADPVCAHLKDHILAVAEERWAQEVDADIFNEDQLERLDTGGEAPAVTNEAIFEIMNNRLSDLDDLLLCDISPRETWAKIPDERLIRREIARELKNKSNGIYTVDQEAVTADEKKTDIRLRFTDSDYEAVIELKRGEEYTAKELVNAIKNQLAKKYMAAKRNKAGALLVTLAKNRQWRHPVTKKMIKAEGLLSLLTEEANKLQDDLGGGTLISVHLLDLRARLSPESKK